MPKRVVRLPNGKNAFDMTTILDIQKLTQKDAMLKKQFEGSRAHELMREIRNLEDHALECIVENLQKEVDQVANAATRLQEIAACEDKDAQEKRVKVKNCLEQIIKEYGDCLSDPDAFAEDFYNRLDEIGETLSAEAGPSGSLLDASDLEEWHNDEGDENVSALTQLNRATRKKLLVQVELDRIDEELRMEIEKNAMSEPASHPVVSDQEIEESDVTHSDEVRENGF
ncbi:hypothetical protein BSKO_10001 [Bryopsis sp. KO-2023]|nr:hypothetical protein BSKO_10001 [Bryopsis sp. KO-2023]